jgi:hypothetical protein
MTNGTFEKIGKSEERMYGPKGIIVCGYPPPEHEPLANALEKLGFEDRPIIFVTNNNASETLKDVLAFENRSGLGQPSDMARAVIMSGFTQEEVHRLMNAYRQAGLPRQLWATLTPASETWSVSQLLEELAAEDEALKKTTKSEPT